MKSHDLASHFLTWQCRIRQIAMRDDGGRPSEGMRPTIIDGEGNVLSDGIVTLLVRENSKESTEFFKFQVQKHNSPEDIYKKSLIFLQSTHYHGALEFSEEMTALFAPGSKLVERLMVEGKCILQFEQFNQRYTLPCRIRKLAMQEPAFQATIWHNRVFNPVLGDDVWILGFQPDWDEAIELMEKAKKQPS